MIIVVAENKFDCRIIPDKDMAHFKDAAVVAAEIQLSM
jgi:hypothetical protein